MQFSFSTLYMAIIASNVLLILLTLCFYNNKILVNAGYRLLALFVSFTLIRFLLPFEFPFAQTIYFPEWLSWAIMWVRHPLFYIAEYEITLWTGLQCIWFAGFMVKLVQYIREQRKSRYEILSRSLDVTDKEPYQRLLTQVCAEKNKKNVFQVWTVSGINAPLLYGIRKPCILLPDTLQVSEEDLYYVFAHEVSHHFHHDMITKVFIRIVDMIYWWNPFCRILVRQTDTILEMRIDNTITLSDTHTITNYLGCLLQLTEQAAEDSIVSDAVTIPLLSATDGEMEQRFEMLVASSEKKKRSLNLALLLFVLCIYVLSYAFILEAYYTPPEIEEATMDVTEDAFYAILKEDNSYDIYYNGIFLENTDTLEYHTGIQVYTEKEYDHETH